MTILGTDQSSAVDAAALAAAGFGYSVSRCVMEPGAVDPTFAANVAAARAAGQVAGGYCFLTGGEGAAKGAAFVDAIRAAVASGPFLAWLDVERPDAHPAPTWADLLAAAQAFHAAWPAHPLGIYLPRWFAPSLGLPADAAAQLAPCYLVQAGYVPTDGDPAATYANAGGDLSGWWGYGYGGFTGATIWQYQGTSTIAGSSVDLSAFRGDHVALLSLAGVPPMRAFEITGPSRSIIVKSDLQHWAPTLDGVSAWPKINGGDRYDNATAIRLRVPVPGGASPDEDRSDGSLVVVAGLDCIILDKDADPIPAGIASVTVEMVDGTTTTLKS